MNVEFQRTARENKKTFFNEQCKEIDENNRMGKMSDRFKKIRDTKGTFHAKMGSIKDRNGMDLTETEDIKKRNGRGPHLKWTQEPQASSPFLTRIPWSLQSRDKRVTQIGRAHV